MFNVDIHTMASVPDHTKKLLESVADSIGFVPNIYAVTAESHHALAGLLAINNMFRDSSFSPEEQQVIRGRIDQSTLMNFLEQGYSKAQFFELALGVSVKTFTNYVSNALSLTLDDAFEPYQWHRDCSHASNLN